MLIRSAIQGKVDQCKSMYEEALAIRRKTLGNEHPDVAMSLNNIGLLLLEKVTLRTSNLLCTSGLN